jgi:CBS domain-containing protein
VTRALVSATPDASASEIARLLSREDVGAVVIVRDGRPVGIVTDRDLRQRVVEPGREPAATPAAAIMSAPLVTLPPDAFAFDAVLAMTRHRIRHVVLVEEGRAVGVVSSRDVLDLEAAHPVAVVRDIERAASVEALAALAPRIVDLVRRLSDEGATVQEIAAIVAELSDRTVVRLLDVAAARLAAEGRPAPLPWAWLAFGSEGRREQTLRTDQDNGLVYADPAPEAADGARDYFQRLAVDVTTALVAIGVPPCPGGAMASNPRWCQPLGVWDGYVRRWIAEPSPEHILAAAMYFDLRFVAGDASLAARLAERIRTEAPAHPRFLTLMARDVVDRRLPRAWLGGFRGAIDIKGAGSIQLVGAARVHALALGVAETNTLERFAAAARQQIYTGAELTEITDAYEHLLRLRLRRQLERLAAGEEPDNAVDPDTLPRRDAVLLREAMKTVRLVQDRLRTRHDTDVVPA